MENRYIDREVQQRIKKVLVDGEHNDTSLALEVGCDCRTFRDSLEDLVYKKKVDWHPRDNNVPKDESVPYGQFMRIYHIARPDFKYLRDWMNKILSVFSRKKITT